MTARDLRLEVIEGDAGGSLAEMKEAFGIQAKPIDTPWRRLHAWGLVCVGGCLNMVRAGDVLYSWDVRPRQQKNGAVIGRVYAQRRGQLASDIGAYKIGATGEVLQVPAALRAILPGAERAAEPDEPLPEEAS